MNQVLGPIKLSAGPVAASATRIGARFEAGMIGLGLAGGFSPGLSCIRAAVPFTHVMSRYGGRYDGDRRSRSPHRSPDRYNDRGPPYNDLDRRRLSGESRANQSAFGANRDGYHNPPFGREPPRGPKALIDGPGGPRGGYAGEYRGRGGRGRGRGFRDDSRDRARDREDHRVDRRDLQFRDERLERTDRSRERERDFRHQGDSFRGRRPSPPRPRSPLGRERDFHNRDRERDVPLGVDAERARRGSRDGPLSAGSSNSDQHFGHQMYRGNPRGGRGRGRGERDRGGRGGRNSIYDDRDRYRSRSQDGRWGGRDMRDERDAPPRIMDDHRPLRDPRDDRSPRERDLIRPKAERNSLTHEQQPQAKEISPPPIAPSAPAYGSIVPSRLPSAGEIQTPTGKAPPTGPRALTEERPVSAGHQAGSERGPSVGPSKAASHDGSPPIPTGPRAQQQQQQQQQPPPQPRPSSKQWINPAISGKRVPDSPKLNRSQSFASQHPRPFDHRPASSGSERQNEYGNRPTSSDAKSDAHTDSHLHSLHMAEPGEILPDHVVRETQSARASIDREMRPPWSAVDSSMPPFGSAASIARASPTRQRQPTASPVMQKHSRDGQLTQTPAQTPAPRPKPRRKPILRVSASRINASPKETLIPPVVDQSSDSDEEDMNDYFEMEIQKAEAEIKKLDGDEPSNSPQDAIAYARLMVMAATRLISEPSSLGEIIGMVPEKQKTPRPETPPASEMQVDAPAPGPPETKATADHPSQPLAWSPARAPAQSTAKPSDQSSAQSSAHPLLNLPFRLPLNLPLNPLLSLLLTVLLDLNL
ncbi:hypothetical protein MCOR02_004214 [Pyricularia oryzae]|nr:hypothetical protein MCOR02_004214 [Pyricularia oryzae]